MREKKANQLELIIKYTKIIAYSFYISFTIYVIFSSFHLFPVITHIILFIVIFTSMLAFYTIFELLRLVIQFYPES